MDLTLRHLGSEAILPWNYVPTALPALTGQPMAGLFPLLPVPLYGPDREILEVVQVDGAVLGDPSALAGALKQDVPWFIGPPANTTADFKARSILPPGLSFLPERQTVYAVIDTGIAFWNRAFRQNADDKNPSRFEDIGLLRFNADTAGNPGLVFLGKAEVDRLSDRARDDGHDGRVIDHLGRTYPDSVFAPGAGRLFDPAGLNHGTASADLLLREDTTAPVFGVELPRSILRDANGAALQGVLAFALRELIARIVEWHIETKRTDKLDLRIAVPFGFTGNSLGGTHPVLRDIADSTAILETAEWSLRVFFPTGNHLQDRLHARLGRLDCDDDPSGLRWFLQPDDHGSNTLELTWHGTELIRFAIGKGGSTVQADIGLGDVLILETGGQAIGALHLQDAGQGWRRLCLSLGPTARQDLAVPVVPAGEWAVGVQALKAPAASVSAYILREDGTRIDARTPPSRQSYFRDAAYRFYKPSGGFFKTDDEHSTVRRAGTLSLLAATDAPNVVACGAAERIGAAFEQAWYSGLPAPGATVEPLCIEVDLTGPSSGLPVLANGSGRIMRLSGTSAAAALAAGGRT